MVAQPRYAAQAQDQVRAQSAASHLAPADARHDTVESPAVALQMRLDAAITSDIWARGSSTPQVDRWPGAARVAVLLVGAGASWALVWQMARLLLPA